MPVRNRKKSIRLVVALLAIGIVFAQQIHSANASDSPSQGGDGGGIYGEATPAAAGSTRNAQCEGPAAFGPMTLFVDGKQAVHETGPYAGEPFHGWQNYVKEGSTIRVALQLADGCTNVPVSLVSYTSVEPYFRAESAGKQVLFDAQTAVVKDSAMRYFSVDVPDCYFQVDLVSEQPHASLDGGNTYKSSLAAAAVGGTKACAQKTEATTTTSSTTTSTTSTTSTTVVPKVVCPEAFAQRVTNYSVEVTDAEGNTTTSKKLDGYVQSGSTVKVNFTVAEGCNEQLTLASYEAGSTSTDAKALAEQSLFDHQTKTFKSGGNSLEVDVPDCYFQVDFARGDVIKDLGTEQYGKRLIDTTVDGQACEEPEVLEKVVVKEVQQPRVLAATGIDLFPMFFTASTLTFIGILFVGFGALARRHSRWDVY